LGAVNALKLGITDWQRRHFAKKWFSHNTDKLDRHQPQNLKMGNSFSSNSNTKMHSVGYNGRTLTEMPSAFRSLIISRLRVV